MSAMMSSSAANAQVGTTKKCSCRIDDTACAKATPGGRPRRDRRPLIGADAGGGGADEHDLVGELGGRNLAAVDVVERVDGEHGPVVAVAIEIGVHLELGIGADAQPTKADAAGLDPDVARPEVEAFRRDH